MTQNVLLTWGVLREENGQILPTNAYALLTGQMRMQPVIQCGVFKGTAVPAFVKQTLSEKYPAPNIKGFSVGYTGQE